VAVRNNRQLFALLFLGVFIYANVALVISREIVIPNFASSINGHIAGDPYYYHTLAIKKAEEIKTMGWREFELHPEGQGPAGIASLFYLIWKNPYSMGLLNAALHGISVVMMAMILMRWFSRCTSIIATLPLAISPFMMVWFSQVNKDSFSLAGALLFTYGLLRLVGTKGESLSRGGQLLSLSTIAIGIFLTWIVRPYVNQMLLPITGLILFIALSLRVGRVLDNGKLIGFSICGALVLACLALLGQGAASDATLEEFAGYRRPQSQAESQVAAKNCFASIDIRNWRNEPLLPGFVNRPLKALMGQRCLMFTVQQTHSNVTTQYSFVDVNRFPNGSAEALAYLPRAALLGIFSPWPDRWGYIFNHRPSFFYTITPVEAAMLYVGLISFIIWVVRGKTWSALIPISLSVTVMTIYGMATPFLGALYRYRYPWWMLMICMGMAALLTLASHWKAPQEN